MKQPDSLTPEQRSSFEGWLSSVEDFNDYGVDPDTGYYRDWHIQRAWAAWQAARSAQSETRDTVLVSRSFLEATPCPNANCCDGVITSTGPDPLHEPCQWCYEKHMILSGAQRA